MNDFYDQMVFFLNETSFEGKINRELQLDDIIHRALAVDQETAENNNENCSDNNTDTAVSPFDMTFLFQYINNDKEKNDFQRVINDSNALPIQTPWDKLTNISELFPEFSIKTDSLPIYEQQQQLPLEYIDLYEKNNFVY